MKTFSTTGTGGGQTLTEIETDKIPIYETSADADADLANLAVGQIIGITDTGDELAQPVDVVEEDNLHAVSSNAVAKALTLSSIDPLDGTGISQITLSTTNQIAPYNGFITIGYKSSDSYARSLYVNDIVVGGTSYAGGLVVESVTAFTYAIKKGDTFRVNAICNLQSARWFVNQ